MSAPKLERNLGALPMLAISTGAIIGSAWLFAPMFVAQVAGPGAIFTWLIAIGVSLLLALVYAELGATFPVAGGLARFSFFSHGGLAGFVAGMACWLGYVAIAPIEVQAMVRYLADEWPWLLAAEGSKSLSGSGFVLASGLLLGMSAINLMGVSWFGESNKILTIWKVLVPVSIPILLMSRGFEGGNFTDHGGFMPNGWSGVFAGVSTGGALFAMLGFRAAIELAGEARNPQRDVPLALIGSVLLTGGIYLLIQIGFIGAIPQEALSEGWSKLSTEVAAGPFVELAAAAGLAWLVKVIFIDSLLSPGGCGLVFASASARLSFAMARNGQLPGAFARLNRKGVPAFALGVNFLVGLVFFAPSQTWQSIVSFISSIQIISLAFGPLALLTLRRSAPDVERRFRLPFAGLIGPVAFVAANVIVYWCGWETNRVCFGLLAVLAIGFATVHRIRKSEVPLDLEGLRWLLPWMLAMAAISWLGNFGGGTGTIPAGWDVAAIGVTSLVVLRMAMVRPATRLPEQMD
ncbi:MAG: APC family permease [Phycisphaerales bacterium]|jgi:amino acid transporter